MSLTRPCVGGLAPSARASIARSLAAVCSNRTNFLSQQQRQASSKAATLQDAIATEDIDIVSSRPRMPSTADIRSRTQLGMSGSNTPSAAYNRDYQHSLERIAKIKEQYMTDRYVFVKHDEMIPILRGLGAKDDDFSSIETVSDSLPLDPTLPFRESKNGRFCFDPVHGSIRRLEFQPFVLSVTEDFKRHDSDTVRHFAEIGNDLQLNTVFQALLLFQTHVLHGIPTAPRQHLDYADTRWICTVFNLRTVTTPDLVGEPALEGVHTDGVDHTMTTFLGSDNMSADSCVTALHTMAEETGIAHNRTAPEHRVDVVQHRKPLDTLLIADNERKHSLSPLEARDPSLRSTRDMLIFFTRKPAAESHVSSQIDSKVAHPHMPMEIPLRLPKLSWRMSPR